MTRSSLTLGIVLTGVAAVAAAQSPDRSGPPPVISIGREEIKPGRMAAHEKVNAAFAAVMSKASSRDYWLGLVPISGDDNSALFLQAFDSFAAVESLRKANEEMSATLKTDLDALDKQGADLHASQRTTYARYRPDLSFHPSTMEEVAQSRYFAITTLRVKYNRIPDYVEYVKALNAAREKASFSLRLIAYQVTTGGAVGTFVTFRPLKSLQEWDDEFAKTADMTKALTEAAGGEDAARKLRLTGADIVVVADTVVYAMSPKISRPAPEFAKFDSAFWTPKPDTRTGAVPPARPSAPKPPNAPKKEEPKQ